MLGTNANARETQNRLPPRFLQWLIDRGHTDPELFELMTMVRDKSEAVLDWQDWYASSLKVPLIMIGASSDL